MRASRRVALTEVDRVADACQETIHAWSVLDVGTGSGLFAELFLARGMVVTGVDRDPVILATARRLVPRARFVVGVAESLPLADAAFDVVFLGHVLHETNDVVRTLREARRTGRRRVVVLEWPYRKEPIGPVLSRRVAPGRVQSIADRLGFAKLDTLVLEHMVVYRLER